MRRISLNHLLICIVIAALFGAHSEGADNKVVWQLQLRNSQPNCFVMLARVNLDSKSHAVFELDTQRDQTPWHPCIILPKGLLKSGQDYMVTFDYEVIQRFSEDCFFYILARSARLGYGADQSERWSGEAGARGNMKLRLRPLADDYVINLGIYRQGAIRISNLVVLSGNGWKTISLKTNLGAGQLPALPSGAQPFRIDPPINAKGPVLNLADFGAAANGDLPPSSGPDKNHDAFVAALAKCHELRASKLVVPKGIYRITSGETITFDGLTDFTFDGGGSTFLFDQIKSGAAGILIKNCHRTVFAHFNLDWDWKVTPLASVGRVLKVADDDSFFEMRFETTPPLDPKRWLTMNPLDEKLRVPGAGEELGLSPPKQIKLLSSQTVRVWPSHPISPKLGQLYLLRHYIYDKTAFVLTSDTHLLMQDVTIFSFPGNAFSTGGDQDHIQLSHCRITCPPNNRRPITVTGGGFMLDQSHGWISLQDCDFGYLGDDCVDVHDDNIHSGVRRLDDHTLVAIKLAPWRCPFRAGDPVEIRNSDLSPTGFTGILTETKEDYKNSQTTLHFKQTLPNHIPSDAILFNRRFETGNLMIRNCYFHENRARGVLCNSGSCLIEGNRFFHNQHAALELLSDVTSSWAEGFGARDVIVRGNTFASSNSAVANNGATVYISADVYGTPTHYPLLKDLLLEDNLFEETTGPAIEARSFQNLIVRNNRIVNQQSNSALPNLRGSMSAELGNGLWIEGNQWTRPKGNPQLLIDPQTAPNVVCQNNQIKE